MQLHVEAVGGVDRGTCGHADGLVWRELQGELLQEHGHGGDGLHQGELVTHTLAGATAEGDVPGRIRRGGPASARRSS